MKPNMGTIDKAARILVALLIGIGYFTDIISGSAAIVLLVFASVFIITSFLSFCPLYSVLGISTRRKQSEQKV
jgi:hypothetical protein